VTVGALGWVLLYVKDLETEKVFYRDKVGLRVAGQWPGGVAFDTGPCKFELMERPGLTNDRTGWDRNVALISFSVVDLDVTSALLRDRGVTQASEVRLAVGSNSIRLVQFQDPEGNLFEIIEMPT